MDLNGKLLTNESGVINRWIQYYDEHLNGNVGDIGGKETHLGTPTHDDILPAPDVQDVRVEIGKLKNKWAASKNQLPGELYKFGGENLMRALYWIVSKIWDEEKTPQN